MKKYFIDDVNVIIDGEKSQVVTVSGENYNPNAVHRYAEGMVREVYPDSTITSIILSHKDVDIEEYEAIWGSKPEWHIDTMKDSLD